MLTIRKDDGPPLSSAPIIVSWCCSEWCCMEWFCMEWCCSNDVVLMMLYGMYSIYCRAVLFHLRGEQRRSVDALWSGRWGMQRENFRRLRSRGFTQGQAQVSLMRRRRRSQPDKATPFLIEMTEPTFDDVRKLYTDLLDVARFWLETSHIFEYHVRFIFCAPTQ